MDKASRTVGLFPISTAQIYNAAFAELRGEDDSDELIGHGELYEEARITMAERPLWVNLGLGISDVNIESSWMSKDTNKNILWVRLKSDSDYMKRVKTRAGVKRPKGLSIREEVYSILSCLFQPGLQMYRKVQFHAFLKFFLVFLFLTGVKLNGHWFFKLQLTDGI